jgi:hypothetical protein
MSYFGRSPIHFDMFDLERSADEARRAHKIGSLYHKGQDLAWDGREVLSSLIAKHGGVRVDAAKADALGEIFAIIMWGELGAWRISLQLADALEELEPKMAATSQAHDEARHFYVMYDYLTALGRVPRAMNRTSRQVLDLVLETDDVARKLLGMQLMVESTALTIFQIVREAGYEPVLAELLRYYEKDEARHVGLGVQLLPTLMSRMSRAEATSLFVFQLRVIFWSIAGLRAMLPAMKTLGIDPRYVFHLGRAKQTLAFRQLGEAMGVTEMSKQGEYVTRSVNAICEAVFRKDGDARGLVARTLAGWRGDLEANMPHTTLDPTS